MYETWPIYWTTEKGLKFKEQRPAFLDQLEVICNKNRFLPFFVRKTLIPCLANLRLDESKLKLLAVALF